MTAVDSDWQAVHPVIFIQLEAFKSPPVLHFYGWQLKYTITKMSVIIIAEVV